jgi:hypothetical protein
MRRPNRLVAHATTGMVASASAVSGALMPIIRVSAAAAVNTVRLEYMIAGPQSIRTAPRSLVARAIRSPVVWRWKKPSDSSSSLAK